MAGQTNGSTKMKKVAVEFLAQHFNLWLHRPILPPSSPYSYGTLPTNPSSYKRLAAISPRGTSSVARWLLLFLANTIFFHFFPKTVLGGSKTALTPGKAWPAAEPLSSSENCSYMKKLPPPCKNEVKSENSCEGCFYGFEEVKPEDLVLYLEKETRFLHVDQERAESSEGAKPGF